MGTFVRRPLEHLLMRLTALWLQSQPRHLRHFAIVRDTILSGTTPIYVQYSFPNFEARVASGQAFWEAVKCPAADNDKKAKRKPLKNNPIDSTSPELDEFGFPATYVPSSQYKGARATLGQSLLASQPGDLLLSNRDPLIYPSDSGTYAVRYDAVETSASQVRSAWLEVSKKASLRESPQSTSSTPKPRPRNLANTPIGRPRKFLRGTEKFWRGQFAMARGSTNPKTCSSKAGTMSDPAGLSLFARRPPEFDVTLTRALESNLPIPAKPKDITQSWVDKMLAFLNRSTAGLYVTPKGARHQGSKMHKCASRILVIRSSRLCEMRLLARKEAPMVRFLVSSAAHTFPDLGNDFLGQILDDSEDDTASLSSSYIRAQTFPATLESFANETPTSQHHKIFDPSGVGIDSRTSTDKAATTTQSTAKRPRGRPRRTSRGSHPAVASQRERTPSAQRPTNANSLASKAKSGRPLGLPPPLRTRASARNDQIVSHLSPPVIEVQAASIAAPETQSNEDLDTVPENAEVETQPETSIQINEVPELEDFDEIDSQRAKHSSAVTSSDKDHLGNVHDLSGPDSAVNGVFREGQANAHSMLLPLIPPPPEPQTGLSLLANGFDNGDASRTDLISYHDLSSEERQSEAYKLVQELTSNEVGQSSHISGAPLDADTQQGDSPIPSPGASGQGDLPELRISDIDSDHEPPESRSKQSGRGAGSVAVLRRKLMLDLMDECGGAMPYHPRSLCIAFAAAWQKAGQSGKPDLKTMKAVVKSLCQNGNAKQIKFSHTNKRGIMATKTILAQPDMAISNNVILEIQRSMIEADPHPYLPRPFDGDSEPKQDIERHKAGRWPAVYEEQTVETSLAPAIILRLQLREALAHARRRQKTTDREASDVNGRHDLDNGNVVPRARVAGIKRKFTRKSGLYKRPKLFAYHGPQPHLRSSPDQPTKNPAELQFRTETPQGPLIFEALALQSNRTPDSRAGNLFRNGEESIVLSPLDSVPGVLQEKELGSTNIVWKKVEDQPVFPLSLEDILLDDHERKTSECTRKKEPNYREFEWKVDGVALWEQRSINLFDSKSSDLIFINHTIGKSFQAAPEPKSNVRFNGLIWYDHRGREHTEKRFHNQNDMHPSVNASHSFLQWKPQKVSQQAETESVIVKPSRKRNRASVDPIERAKRRRRGDAPVTQPQTITDSAGNLIDVSHLIGAKYKRPRGIQHLRTMPGHLIYKLTVTIVIVRALAGGLEKQVDWPLVMRIFPDEDQQFFKDRWKTLSNKHRRDIEQLTENFQDKFPDAYDKGEVPQLNFDHTESIDWEAIVEWALNSLDKPVTHEIPDLPATRSEFDKSVTVKIEPPHRPYRDMFGYNQPVTVPMKETAIAAIPFAVPLPPSSPSSSNNTPHLPDPTDDTSNLALALAKSWALSTVTTPLQVFDPAKAHSKLQSVAPTAKESETLIASAMKSLNSDRAIAKKHDKGVDAKGRRFDLSRVFTDTLDQRRTINLPILKQAVHYKTAVLDPAFRKGEVVKFQPVTVEDGEMTAILNLAAHGRIRIQMGDDVPRNRWGIDPDSRYQTRTIKKETMYFTVLLVQNPNKYVFGNPLLDSDTPIPDLGTGDGERIPIWRDIRGGYQRNFWNLALAAVLGILASRPGASVREVSKMMHPSLTAWEVESLLFWSLEVGAVKKTGQGEGGWTGGWEVTEWWWMALECGRVDSVPEQVADLVVSLT
jgi:hypothetical protein